ncbi:MAG: hypothetical protein WKF82_10375 [Nocardioidaceae bacterium]
MSSEVSDVQFDLHGEITDVAELDQMVSALERISDEDLTAVDAWWRANNYLTVGQIYLQEQPAARASRSAPTTSSRGCWVTGGPAPDCRSSTPMRRALIRHTGQQMLYLAGPGHGGPALVAAGYLEGSYTETYPQVVRGRGRACSACSASSPAPAASPATSP